MVSMNDVARAAGVSQKTVSRVVNGEPHVRQDVADRVREAIGALGFRPNAAARALVTRRSRRIGVISVGRPATMIDGLERAVREAGYALALIRASAEVQAAVDALAADGVDGIVLSEPAAGEVITAPRGIPLVTVSPGAHEDPATIQAGTGQSDGARRATAHLLGLGHRTVAHIAGPPERVSARQRVHGWRAALRAAGAPEIAPVPGDWSAASGFAAMRELLERGGVTAVFAANDQMAIGAMRAIQCAGLRVPADVGVVGFDDIPEAAFLSVSLTTVRQDQAEVARRGVRHLVRAIEGVPGAGPVPVPVPVELIVRESSGGRVRTAPDRSPPA